MSVNLEILLSCTSLKLQVSQLLCSSTSQVGKMARMDSTHKLDHGFQKHLSRLVSFWSGINFLRDPISLMSTVLTFSTVLLWRRLHCSCHLCISAGKNKLAANLNFSAAVGGLMGTVRWCSFLVKSLSHFVQPCDCAPSTCLL